MKISPSLILSITGSILFNVSCKSVYEPNAVNIPLMQNKSELIVSVDQKNLQAAYAVTDHIALMTNGFFTNKEIGGKDGEQGGYGYLAEGAIGYYMPLQESNFVFETYAGLGGGKAFLENNVKDDDGNIIRRTFDANALKYFIQPDIGYKSRFFDAGFGTRFSIIDYAVPVTTNYSRQQINNDHLNRVGYSPYFFLEPAITIRAGYKFAKLQLQYCHSIKLNDDPLNYAKEKINVGIFFDINNMMFNK